LLLCRYLGCGREWLYVPELSQKGVLIVVAPLDTVLPLIRTLL